MNKYDESDLSSESRVAKSHQFPHEYLPYTQPATKSQQLKPSQQIEIYRTLQPNNHSFFNEQSLIDENDSQRKIEPNSCAKENYAYFTPQSIIRSFIKYQFHNQPMQPNHQNNKYIHKFYQIFSKGSKAPSFRQRFNVQIFSQIVGKNYTEWELFLSLSLFVLNILESIYLSSKEDPQILVCIVAILFTDIIVEGFLQLKSTLCGNSVKNYFFENFLIIYDILILFFCILHLTLIQDWQNHLIHFITLCLLSFRIDFSKPLENILTATQYHLSEIILQFVLIGHSVVTTSLNLLEKEINTLNYLQSLCFWLYKDDSLLEVGIESSDFLLLLLMKIIEFYLSVTLMIRLLKISPKLQKTFHQTNKRNIVERYFASWLGFATVRKISQKSKKSLQVEKLFLQSHIKEKVLRKLLIQQFSQKICKTMPFFHSFSKDAIKKISESFEDQFYEPGQAIFTKDGPDDCSLYIIQQGVVQFNFTLNLRESNLFEKKAGQYFGEFSFITGQQREFNAFSQTNLCLLRIRRDEFVALIQQFSNEYEQFCNFKDTMIFDKDFSAIKLKCQNCECLNHSISTCPQLHYIPNKIQIVAHHILCEDQERVQFARFKNRRQGTQLVQADSSFQLADLTITVGQKPMQEGQIETFFRTNSEKIGKKYAIIDLHQQNRNVELEQDQISPMDLDQHEISKEIIYARNEGHKATVATAGFGIQDLYHASEKISSDHDYHEDTQKHSSHYSPQQRRYSTRKKSHLSNRSMTYTYTPIMSNQTISNNFNSYKSILQALKLGHEQQQTSPISKQISIQPGSDGQFEKASNNKSQIQKSRSMNVVSKQSAFNVIQNQVRCLFISESSIRLAQLWGTEL